MKHSTLAFILCCLTACCFAQDPHADNEIYVSAPPLKNVPVLRAAYDAFEKNDFAPFTDLIGGKTERFASENFPNNEPFSTATDWECFKISALQIFSVENDKVLAIGNYEAKNKKTGKTIKVPIAHLWWFDHDKIVKFQQYADTKKCRMR